MAGVQPGHGIAGNTLRAIKMFGVWHRRGFTLETDKNRGIRRLTVAIWAAAWENGESNLRIDNLGFV